MNLNSQPDKKQVAKKKFDLGKKKHLLMGYFLDAVNLYRESGKIYDELKMKKESFMAFLSSHYGKKGTISWLS